MKSQKSVQSKTSSSSASSSSSSSLVLSSSSLEDRLQSIEKRIELLENFLSGSPLQKTLSLGPVVLSLPTSGDFSIENLLAHAHNLQIPEKWARTWFVKQKALGWKDSYGKPIRTLGHYLHYCWRVESEKRPERPRQGDLTLGGYADYSKDGKSKPPKILPIPREATEDDFKLAGEEAKKLVEGLRAQLEKSG